MRLQPVMFCVMLDVGAQVLISAFSVKRLPLGLLVQDAPVPLIADGMTRPTHVFQHMILMQLVTQVIHMIRLLSHASNATGHVLTVLPVPLTSVPHVIHEVTVN